MQSCSISLEKLREFQKSPDKFRAFLKIRKGRTTAPFVPDPWQEENLSALDPMWKKVAGLIPEEQHVHKFAWLGRPRGHSKTMDEAMQLCWVIAFSKKPLNGIAAAGAKDQAKFIRDAVLRILLLNPWLGPRGANLIRVQNYRVFNPQTKSEVDIISSDAPSSFGATPDFILCDELTHWRSDLSGKCELWESLFSSADKVPHCILVIMTNAGYERTWQAGVRDMAKTDPENWIYRDLEKPCASWMGTSFLDRQRKGITKKSFARLWLNIWQLEAGDALEAEDILACVKDHARPMHGDELGWIFIGGLDLSTKRHRSAFVVLAANPVEHRVKLASCKNWKPNENTGKVDLMKIEAEVAELHKRFHFRKVLYDPHQAELMGQRLAKIGMWTEEMTFGGGNLTLMAVSLIETFKARHIELYNEPKLLDDLTRLNIVERSFGFKIEAPEGDTGHADTAFALAIALPAAVELAAVRPVNCFTDRSMVVAGGNLAEMHRLQAEQDNDEKAQKKLLGEIEAGVELAMMGVPGSGGGVGGFGNDGAALIGELSRKRMNDKRPPIEKIIEECGIELEPVEVAGERWHNA